MQLRPIDPVAKRRRMMLFTNNGGPGLRQALLDGAPFLAELTHSLVLQRGTGSPTFTRASTATFRDWEGVLKTVPSGCARFEGARMVRNLLTFTEDFSNAAWVKSVTTVTADSTIAPDGTASADLVTADVGTSEKYIGQNATSASPSVISIYAKQGTHGLIQILNGGGANFFANFDLSSGVVGNTGAASVAEISNAGNGWYRCSVKFAGAINDGWFVSVCDNIGNGYYPNISTTGNFYLWGAQLEDVTGQTTQTAGEYVSVGVESAPAYHGSMVDGVKCFPTDRSGNPISTTGSYPLVGYVPWEARTNLCLRSNAFTTTWAETGTVSPTQNLAGPDGGTTGWTLTDNDAGTPEGIFQTYGALTAANYAQSIFIRKTSGATSFPVIRLNEPVTPKEALCTVDTNNGIATVWTAYTGSTIVTSSASCVSHNADWWRVSLVFSATTASWRIIFYPAGTANATQSTGTVSAAATGACGIYGSQLELGSLATPYIPTTTVAVARNADVDQYPTTAGPIAAVGAISLDFTPYHAPSGTIALWGTYVDASNYTAILHDATNLIFRKRIAGSNYDATIANAFVSGTTYKVAATWGAAGTAIYLDGVAGTPHANTTAAQIAATMQVGADGNSLQQPGAGTTNLRIWQRQLSISEGVAVTA